MIIKAMIQNDAQEIAQWHYEGIYSFYDQKSDPEDYDEFIDPEKRGDKYFSVFQDNELIGFLSFTEKKFSEIYLGLGMRPDQTGKGNGLNFLYEGIEYIKEKYSPNKVSLAVATFNKRAIKVYQRAGFKVKEEFLQKTNGSIYTFIKMELDIKNQQ